MKRLWLILALSGLLFGCSAPTTLPHDQSSSVQVHLFDSRDISQCRYLGEITGSEGHWYSYLFFPNDILVQGALNELKTNAVTLGADTLLLSIPQLFHTSVTMLGIAYDCKNTPAVK